MLHLAASLLGLGNATTRLILNEVVPGLVALVASGLSFAAWRKDLDRASGRSSWLWMSIILAAFATSEGLAICAKLGMGPVKELSLAANLVESVAPWILVASGLDFYFRFRDEHRMRPLIDGLLSAAALALPDWYFLAKTNWLSFQDLSIVRIVDVLEPVALAACLLGAVAISQCLYHRGNLRRGPMFMSMGLAAVGVFGSFGSYVAADQGSRPVNSLTWVDAGILIGGMLLAVSAIYAIKDESREWRATPEELAGPEPTVFAIFRSIQPFMTASLSFFLTALHELHNRGGVTMGVIVFGFVLSAAAIFRQMQTLSRNQRMLKDNALLTEKLKSVSEGLEETIVHRTAQLHAIHQLTKSVNNTLEPEKVLSMTAVHTKTAVHADAVVIWNAEKDGKGGTLLKGALQIGLANSPHIAGMIYQMPASEEIEAIPLPGDPRSGEAQAGTLLRAPVFAQQRLIGMIGAIKLKGAFHKTDWEMLESIGLEAGTALHHARQYTKAIEEADMDPVTGLLNHRAIHQRFDDEIEHAASASLEIAVMMMDMNNFKMFNDTYGHPAGDEALRRVARALGEAVKGKGHVGRYGGDEFLAILPSMAGHQASELARAVQAKLQYQGFMPNPQDGRVIPLQLSFGIACFPHDSTSRHEIIAIADSNLYSAKRSEGGVMVSSDSQRQNRTLKSEHSFAVLDGMVTAVDNKDSYTRRHSEDVAEYALWIGEQLGMSSETLKSIRIGALLHDVGKICVPDEILRKPGRLTAEEYEVLKRHPRLGALIVGGVPGMEGILDIVQYHHERWDGGGYPDGLEGEEIPILGRLLAVADTFSAMTTDRPYRKGMDWTRAINEIRANSGSQFDPAMAEAFMAAVAKRRAAGQIPEQAFGELVTAAA